MMRVAMRVAILTVVAMAAVTSAAHAQESSGVTVVKGGLLRLEGTSTLHSYLANAKEYQAVFGPIPNAGGTTDLWGVIAGHQIERFKLSIPVKGLASGESGLDDNMRKALRADVNPAIEFRMTSYEVISPTAPGGAATLKLKGTLEVAGVTHDVEVDVDVKAVAGGLRLSGSKVLSMADYNVQPPVLMLGMLRTGDKVTIRFELELRNG
jgi:polyisoprenoid-binding protein YceI